MRSLKSVYLHILKLIDEIMLKCGCICKRNDQENVRRNGFDNISKRIF